MTTGFEAKIAGDLIKPAAGFVDALLGPKIEQVRAWSRERELSKIVGSEKLDQLLQNHLQRTIRKASELTSIVFPQTPLPLNSVYEPVSLKTAQRSTWGQETNRADIDLASDGLSYFIVDEAGMGKSTYLRHLVLRVVSETGRVPVLFELAGYNKDFGLIENVARCLDDFDKPFDRRLFQHLVVTGRFFFFLDGFDELPASLQEKLRPEFIELNEKKGRSSLLISSRPQNNFPNLVQCSQLRIEKLNSHQAESLVRKYDAFARLDIGNRLITEFHRIPDRFLETPLLVGLLYRTFAFNNSIAEKVSVFYSELFDALYKGHDLTKSGFVREKASGLDVDAFREILRAFSLLYVLDSASGHTLDQIIKMIGGAGDLCTNKLASPRSYCDDLLLAVPLLARDGNSIRFMHRTIAEYFAAEFIVSSDDSSGLMKKMLGSPSAKNLSQVFEFVYEIAPSIYNEVITKPIAGEFLDGFGNSGWNDMCCSAAFLGNTHISLWLYDEVRVDGDDGLDEVDIPNIPANADTFTYLYGTLDGKKYVACVACQAVRVIPNGALRELATVITRNDVGLIANREEDFDVTEALSVIQPGVWHPVGSEEIGARGSTHFLAVALYIGGDLLGAISRGDGATYVLSVKKAKHFLESSARLTKAQADLRELFA